TKENALWAPLAAAVTVLLRPKMDESVHRRLFTAAAMLLPVAMWLSLRFAFFGGIGNTYATAGYTPFADFLKFTFEKLTHLHYLFIVHKVSPGIYLDRGTALIVLDRATALLIYVLLFLWALGTLTEAANRLRQTRKQNVNSVFLVALWAAFAL